MNCRLSASVTLLRRSEGDEIAVLEAPFCVGLDTLFLAPSGEPAAVNVYFNGDAALCADLLERLVGPDKPVVKSLREIAAIGHDGEGLAVVVAIKPGDADVIDAVHMGAAVMPADVGVSMLAAPSCGLSPEPQKEAA